MSNRQGKLVKSEGNDRHQQILENINMHAEGEKRMEDILDVVISRHCDHTVYKSNRVLKLLKAATRSALAETSGV